jgi:hypothetical protein
LRLIVFEIPDIPDRRLPGQSSFREVTVAAVDCLVVLWIKTINLEHVFTYCLFQTQPGLIGQAKNNHTSNNWHYY